MIHAQRMHDLLAHRPGLVGSMYNMCYEAIASTWYAVDLEFRLANYSDYSRIQLVWDAWIILESLVMPRVLDKFNEWRCPPRIEMSHTEDTSRDQYYKSIFAINELP